MLQDVDLAGNSYSYRPGRLVVNGRVRSAGENTIRRLRPDWVSILLGSQMDPEENPAHALDAEVLGYFFQPGGPTANREPIFLPAETVAHFAPIPDPTARFRGMSWLTPIISEIMADGAATSHKLKFFENGATPNMVVTAHAGLNQESFDVWVAKMSQKGVSLGDAYKTLYLANGADAKVLGTDLKGAAFEAVQGAGETRIAAAAGVPPIIVGLSEGLDAATYSNYGQARRAFADLTMRPLWRNVAGSLSTLIDVPPESRTEGAAELWYDDRDIPFLAEDVKDAALSQQIDASTVSSLIDAGFQPDDVVAAVVAGDLKRLKGKHTGLFSVQLQAPGTVAPPNAPVAPPVKDDKSNDDAGRALDALLDQ
jgi:hypothetical protein